MARNRAGRRHASLMRARRGAASGERRPSTTLWVGAAAVAVVAAGCIPYDLTGDLGADHVVVDGNGDWRVLGTDEVLWNGPTITGLRTPAPGNFDGADRWEPAVADPATGRWTTGGARGTFTFAAPADPGLSTTGWVVPVPGDYDGDGDTEAAWFVDDSAEWHIEGRAPFVHGRPVTDPSTPSVDGADVHDLAAPADYDGDGDTDPAVYRIETGEIHVLGGSTIVTGLPYGLPAPANVGPGPGDEAVVLRYDEGTWAVEGSAPIAAGASGVVPIPADYDGDGTADLAYVGPGGAVVVAGATVATLGTGLGPVALRPPVAYGTLLIAFLESACVAGSDPECP